MYNVKFGGKKGQSIHLVESPDLVVIRTRGNQQIDSVDMSNAGKAAVAQSTEVASFPEAGISVRRVNGDDTKDALHNRDETRAILKNEENIRFAGRALQDAATGEVMLYTENFFVKFKDNIPEAECLKIIEQYHLVIKSKLKFATNAYFVCANEGTGLKVFDISAQLMTEKAVELCHPELVQERRFKAIHPLQWHLKTTVIGTKKISAHVQIEAAWKITRGKGATIAIIDDGIDVDHPEFTNRVVHAFNATDNTSNPRPQSEDDKHGTACAGMACASGLPDGASGTAPEAFLMPIRLRSGLGSMAEANAFAWAADQGADVISCSWGPTDGAWWDAEDPIHQRIVQMPDSTRLAIQYALTKGRKGKGCVVLFAAGNGNEPVMNDGYASFPEVITVAACNDRSKRSVYSDFGPAITVCFPSRDFQYKPFKHPAPRTSGLRTTDISGNLGYSEGDFTDAFGGTSGACPGMAGIVALMIAVNPALTPPDIKTIIQKSCKKIDVKNARYNEHGHSDWYGYGRIDAGKAVKNALAFQKTNAVEPPIESTKKAKKTSGGLEKKSDKKFVLLPQPTLSLHPLKTSLLPEGD
jgi:subtilisin family serine protease